MKYDVVIIGAGLGGLECGYILSRQGKRVLILEQSSQPGGCMQSYRRGDFRYDTGFHYVGGLDEGQSLFAAFNYLGLLDLPWHRLDPDGFDRITIADRSFAFSQGYEAFAERLAEAFPMDRTALQRYAQLLKQSSELQFAGLSDTPLPNNPSDEWLQTGAWDYLKYNFQDPLLVNVLSGTSLKMELRKESLPLFTFLHGNSSFVESSWRLKGDASLLVDTLVKGIRKQGGEVLCGVAAGELIEEGGELTSVCCSNGERYEADIFVSDIHPAQTCRLVRESKRIKSMYRRRIDALENTFGMFTVSLRMPAEKLRYFNHNHYIYKEPNVWSFPQDSPEVGGVLVSCRVPEDGTDYTPQVDLLTPMPTEVTQMLEAGNVTKVGRRGEDYKLWKEQRAVQCIELAAQHYPELRKYVQCYTSTALTWRDYTLTPGGSAYGVRKDFRNPLMTTLSPRTPIPNLLLTGQNLMLHGVHGVTMTAFYTCAEILGKEPIRKIVENR
jgi:all-trans-retinol 13,14-reductase